MLYEQKDYRAAMADLNRVLEEEPGNALTLYNRGLINAQVGAYEDALSDMDRVLNINPENVLAYFNRASVFIEMGRYQDALEDYDRAIELYPDFAKAYMNRSYVKNMLGDMAGSKEDYRIAQEKVAEYRTASSKDADSFADTTRKYSSLIALDAADLSRSCDAFRIPGSGRDVKEGVLAGQPLQLEKADGDFCKFGPGDAGVGTEGAVLIAAEDAHCAERGNGVVVPAPGGYVGVAVGVGPKALARLVRQQAEEDGRDLSAGDVCLRPNKPIVVADEVGEMLIQNEAVRPVDLGLIRS